ncbi:MAG: hypothetical protein ABI348_08805 [Nitrososphaera sp.]
MMCNNTINQKSLSFEQRLVDDKDFCRECWDKITNAVYPTDNILLHALLLQGRAS